MTDKDTVEPATDDERKRLLETDGLSIQPIGYALLKMDARIEAEKRRGDRWTKIAKEVGDIADADKARAIEFDLNVERLVAADNIAEGLGGCEKLRSLCPTTEAVFRLRERWLAEKARADELRLDRNRKCFERDEKHKRVAELEAGYGPKAHCSRCAELEASVDEECGKVQGQAQRIHDLQQRIAELEGEVDHLRLIGTPRAHKRPGERGK